ncbi:MAG: ATPase [Burkholderiales bacterium]|nr:ATPase [Burkholderiales bacterium]
MPTIAAPASPIPAPARDDIRHWVGVDGGGTGTRARLCDAAGRTLAEGQAGPSALGQGVEQAWRNVRQAVEQAVLVAGVTDFEWAHSAIGLGLSGASQMHAAQAFADAAPQGVRLALETDAWAGLLGAHAGEPGALLIAGTGSIAMALWPDGRRSRVGGWGWRLGDEGSGAWLGQAALRHLVRALDGRESRGALADALLGQLGTSDAGVLAWQHAADQRDHAALALLVFELEHEDPVAKVLLNRAVEELTLHLQALDPTFSLSVCLSGSVALRLAPRLQAHCAARWAAPKGDAMAGALRLIHAPNGAQECE